jgi:hypothetical protein
MFIYIKCLHLYVRDKLVHILLRVTTSHNFWSPCNEEYFAMLVIASYGQLTPTQLTFLLHEH